MTILLIIAWIWLLAGVGGMVLTSPNLVAAIATVYYWIRHPDGKAVMISAWGRVQLQVFLFAKCLLFFILGILGVLQPPPPWAMTVTLVGLTLNPFLMIILALRIARDERRIIATTRREP